MISAPVVNGVIPNGQAQISGDFTQTEAKTLANSLKYGALPLTFTVPSVTEEGPTLASDQLAAGLWAGAIGLALVLLYCMLYYRASASSWSRRSGWPVWSPSGSCWR